MTNLPKALRERLAAETRVDPLERVYEQRSSDGQTVKWLFRLHDGLTIETVLMLYDDVSGSTRERRTVCISTQAGCAMGCVFCATGQAGLARNLTAGEIVAQVLAAARWLAHSDEGPRRMTKHPPEMPSWSFVLRPSSAHQHRRHGHGRADGELRSHVGGAAHDHRPGRVRAGRAARHGLDRRAAAGHPQDGRASRSRSTWPSACTRRTTPCAPGWCRSITATRSRKSWRPCETTSPAPTGG